MRVILTLFFFLFGIVPIIATLLGLLWVINRFNPYGIPPYSLEISPKKWTSEMATGLATNHSMGNVTQIGFDLDILDCASIIPYTSASSEYCKLVYRQHAYIKIHLEASQTGTWKLMYLGHPPDLSVKISGHNRFIKATVTSVTGYKFWDVE
jgi:hypothetical protein